MSWQQITAAYMPALVIMVTVYIAAVSNNKRIDDLRADLRDLRTEMREGFHKIEGRLEHPITRP